MIPLPTAPAEFHSMQEGFGFAADFENWALTADIPGHPVRSLVSRATLEAAGYYVPPAPATSPVREAVPAHLAAYFVK